MNSSQSLSEEQQQTIKDTLASFDVDSLSVSDATAIVETFNEAGIRPGAALEAALEESGFDAQTVGDMASVDASRPMGPPPGGGGQAVQLSLSDEMMSNLNELLDAYSGVTLEDSERESLLAEIQAIIAEDAPKGILVNVNA
ncbi:MAG: hypothetical protein C1943_15605 [Halochromatium sp.]|nr:hypothetical protein [Halochromatium sp.]